MKTRMVTKSAALVTFLAVLGVVLFLILGPGLSSGSGDSPGRSAGSGSPNAAEGAPADTAKAAPTGQVRKPDIKLPMASGRELAVDATQFRQLPPRDAIAPVYDASFMPAASASLPPDELVIGVEINGESKAYPVGPLNFREMVNDTVGGVPVLVTW